ncbi:25143_t:CDS:2, partial [Gigaspora rosea]
RSIHENIRLFAACNPYRLRQKADTQAGLSKRYEEKSRLAYQVRPLPDQILDFVWDYGVLKPSDEKIYIDIMVKKFLKDSHEDVKTDLFVELLFESQEFIRYRDGIHSVSLRDMKRAIIIFKFFCESLEKRQELAGPESNTNILGAFSKSIINIAKNNAFHGKGILGNIVKSYILALNLCYQVRFFEQEIRDQYHDRMCEVFVRFGIPMNHQTFVEIIQEEQKDFMKRMTKPSMIAENFALLENVLVMTVCILNRIPLFIIGAPGASKSLSIRIVSQSLRGADSDDPYFRTLPQVYIIPHQGSSSSTSDGIIKADSTKFDVLANSYLTYEKAQPIANFHGLRDYYSLVKSLGKEKV